ncbi:hypothetical protein K3495_g14638, partial [Podosphaera aphanis]
MFGGVASALDEASRGANAPIIPQHLAHTYQLFIERVQEVAQVFFDNHVRGLPNTATTQRGNTDTRSVRQQTPAVQRHTPPPVPKSTKPSSYANVAARGHGNLASTKPRRPAKAQRQNDISPTTDDRLFLRLEQDATERLISAYPLLLHYRKFLGPNAALLKEVQHVPSGIALRPSSEDAASRLESLFSVGIKEGKLKGSTGIEKAQNLVTYLLTSIPRSFTALDDNNQLTNYPITEDLVRAELTEEKGLSPISVHETKGSIESPYSSSARYIARFPIETILPRKFYLFGVEVLSRQLAKRTSVIQCSRCFQWHNERICSRAPRCRLCGSIEHLEANHQPCGPHPHHCTPRCIHCHGPHPADAPECPLRPRRNGLKLSKEQISQIRQTSAAARLSLSATVGCLRRPAPSAPEDHVMTEETFPKFPSNHPFSSPTTTAMQLDMPSSNQLVRASSPSLPLSTAITENPYSPLSDRDEGATPHEIALEFANEQKYDIILIQEPFISRDRQRRITKRISSYECFAPIDSWETRPRVLTYVRKGIGLQTYQLRPLPPYSPAAQDIVFLEVRAPSGIKMLVVNVYNAPSGSIAEGEAVRALLNLPRSIFRCRTFLAGDFNLKHTRWQASVTTNQSAAESLLEWTDLNSISLISEADVPTHNRGNVLDLSFASNSLILAGAESAIIPELDVTSDHLPIGTIIPWDSRFQEPVTRLKLDTLDE